LTFTFMTDVPFLASVVWCFLALVRAVRRESDAWLCAAAALCCAACAIRLTGAVLPLVIAAVLLFDSGDWGRKSARIAAAIIPAVFLAGLLWWYQSHVYRTADLTWWQESPANRAANLKHNGLRILPRMLVQDVTFTAGALGVALIPIVAACLRKRDLIRVAAVSSFLGVILIAQRAWAIPYEPPLDRWAMWNIHELGGTKTFIKGYVPPQLSLADSKWYIALTMIFGGAVLSVWMGRKYQRGDSSLAWWIATQFLLAAGLWLLSDRYALAYLPAAIVMTLASRPIVRPVAAVLLTACFALHSFIGTRDELEYNRVLWSTVDYLRLNGASDAEIGGGYLIDGWLQYAHPENALRDRDGKIQVAGITSRARLRYQVANAPLPGWRPINEFPYRQWLSAPGKVYALERVSQP
jgi:hypothetical protein